MENKSKELVKKFLSRKNDLIMIRSQIETVMDEITELVVPHRSYMSSEMTYSYLPNQDIYDTTGVQSVKYLSSMIDSGTANPGLSWFTLKPKSFIGRLPPIITDYLNYVTASVMNVFADPEAGFYSSNPVVISDMVSYGTACMLINYVPGEGFQFTPIHISEIYIAENAFGRVNTVLRKFKVSAAQCVERFGLDAVPESVKEAYDESPDKLYEVWHYACPNDGYVALKKKAYKNQPFKSCYFIEGQSKDSACTVLADEYLSYFPYNVPRWFKRPNMPWGFGPAINCLPDLRSVQIAEMELLASVQLVGRPILLASDDGVIVPNAWEPGAIIQGGIDSITNTKRIEPLQTGAMPQFLERHLEAKKEAIRKSFYNAALMHHDGPQMTREEVITRKEEQMLALGPDLKLYMEEHLIPSVMKVYHLLKENKLIEEPPEEIKEFLDEGLMVEFNSPLLRYQRIGELQAAERFIQAAGSLANFDPSVVNVVNPRGLLELYREVLQVSPTVCTTIEQQAAMEQATEVTRQQEMQLRLAEMADKNRYMIQQAGGDPNTSAVAAMTQAQGGPNQGGFNGFES